MDDTPQIKHELVVTLESETQHIIYFHATQDAAEDMWQFGFVHDLTSSRPNWYQIDVNPLFDWNEIIEYMKNYDNRVVLDESVWGSIIKKAFYAPD